MASVNRYDLRNPRATACVSRLALCATLALLPAAAWGAEPFITPVPEDFPTFRAPGGEATVESMRELYWLHYNSSLAGATLWDTWLPAPTLWPAVETNDAHTATRARWRRILLGRVMEPDGYVATHQHRSIAHQHGWPFPFWRQGKDTWGWHFSLKGMSPAWHGTVEKTQEGWTLIRGEDLGIANEAWNIRLSEPRTMIETPPLEIDVLQSPFLQFRWRTTGYGDFDPYVEWKTTDAPDFSHERRMYFAPARGKRFTYTMVPVYQHPAWKGRITGLRVGFGNRTAGGTVHVQALFTQYDTRHTVNNAALVQGSTDYFWWTRDIAFLRQQMPRLRDAIRYVMTEYRTEDEHCIVVPYVGHDGRAGIVYDETGRKEYRVGHGIGHNYWDIIPTGHKDGYGTMLFYDALRRMARLERQIQRHPEWAIPGGPSVFVPESLDRHADEIKARFQELFWNPATERFVTGLDADGQMHDYGYTFMNLEAIHYDLASEAQAKAIMAWITGARVVPDDTSTGPDIYRWVFAPRASTKRNLTWYGWYWLSPESLKFGDQVQDGGAVLGFSYHDLMARLRTLGPNDAAKRLETIARWFREVKEAGGYRAYYADGTRGTLQGAGTPGGLGMDKEFIESILVPQVLLNGFLGFQPTPCGFRIFPKLPDSWKSLAIDRIALHDVVLAIEASADDIRVRIHGEPNPPFRIGIPDGEWEVQYFDPEGRTVRTQRARVDDARRDIEVPRRGMAGVHFRRSS